MKDVSFGIIKTEESKDGASKIALSSTGQWSCSEFLASKIHGFNVLEIEDDWLLPADE